MLTRSEHWQSHLAQYLIANRATPFKYGSFDCCLFACNAILAMTGTDPAATFRNKYTSRAQAYAAIKAQAGTASVLAITEAITTKLGMPPVPLGRAQRGDLAIIQRPSDYSLGIVGMDGTTVIVCAENGLGRVPLTTALKAWKV